MDAEGYVDLALLANFNRVKTLTMDVNLIREALLISQVLEVIDTKVRKREGWEFWLLPKADGVAPTGQAAGNGFVTDPAATSQMILSAADNIPTSVPPAQFPAASSALNPNTPSWTAPQKPKKKYGFGSSPSPVLRPRGSGDAAREDGVPGGEDDNLFQFDEEYSRPDAVQKYYMSDEDEDDEDEDEVIEVDDETVARIMIVTQHKRDKSHIPLERSKLNEEISDMINEGLYHYEYDLQKKRRQGGATSNNKKIDTVEQDQAAQTNIGGGDQQSSSPIESDVSSKINNTEKKE